MYSRAWTRIRTGEMDMTNELQQVLAFDIGGTSVKYAYVSLQGEVTKQASFRTCEMKTLKEFLKAILEVIDRGVTQGIYQVGISSLGMFNKEGMCLGGVENLPFLEGANLVKLIKEQYPQVHCHIMNDGVAAAMGEYWLGEGQGCQNFICMTLGTGIGGAIIIEGRPLIGSHFQSGEIGYSNYQSEEDYMELHYSTKGILRQVAKELGVESMSGRVFTEEVKAGEPTCVEVFDQWMDALGKMLANIIMVIDPEKVIIGGGVSGEKEWLCNHIYDKIQLHLPLAFRGKVQVKVAKHGNNAGLLGAAQLYDKLSNKE